AATGRVPSFPVLSLVPFVAADPGSHPPRHDGAQYLHQATRGPESARTHAFVPIRGRKNSHLHHPRLAGDFSAMTTQSRLALSVARIATRPCRGMTASGMS